jgi:ParB family chromosome partitioning protein
MDPAAEKPSKKPKLSQRLVNELAIQRRDILAVHLAADPTLALDLAIFLMVDRDSGYSFERNGSTLSSSPPASPVTGFKTPDARATRVRAEASDTLDRSWADGPTLAERFDLFRELSVEARRAWLGQAVAKTLEASLNLDGSRRCAFHDHLGQLLEVNVADWWRPTAANFFDRVPKAMALEALFAIGGPELAATHAKSKKAELAEACERIFAGNLIADAEVKAAALSWVPEAMRFALPEVPSDEADEDVGTVADEPDAMAGDEDGPFDMPGEEELPAEDRVEEAA